MCTRQYTACVAFFLFIVGSSKIHADDNVAARLSPELTEMLRWLPADTETLVVSNGPFQLEVPRTEEELSETDETPHPVRLFQSLSTGILSTLLDGEFANMMKSHTVEFAIEGSRHFRHSSGMGLMPFQGCQVVCFPDESIKSLQQAMQKVYEQTAKTLLWEGTRIAVFSNRVENDVWNSFVISPRPNIVICATNRRFLEQVLARMNGEPKQKIAFPATLPQWKHIDVEAHVWGMRHYRKLIVLGLDPTYHMTDFITIEALGLAIPVSRSKGLGFHIDEKQARCRHLTVSKIERMIIEQAWADIESFRTNTTLTITALEGDVIEVSVPTNAKDESSLGFSLILLQFLGHGISI